MSWNDEWGSFSKIFCLACKMSPIMEGNIHASKNEESCLFKGAIVCCKVNCYWFLQTTPSNGVPQTVNRGFALLHRVEESVVLCFTQRESIRKNFLLFGYALTPICDFLAVRYGVWVPRCICVRTEWHVHSPVSVRIWTIPDGVTNAYHYLRRFIYSWDEFVTIFFCT